MIAFALGLWLSCSANAEPYVPVDASALIQARPGEGLVTLHSGYRNHPVVDAEAMVWMAGDLGHSQSDRFSGDVLTINVGLRAPDGWGSARMGRLIVGSGAIRPVHMDGLRTRLRMPFGTTLETFAGVPVSQLGDGRRFDWIVGGRLGQDMLSRRIQVGASYVQQRDTGMLANEEVGGDLSLQIMETLWLRTLASWDIAQRGLAAAQAHLQWTHAQSSLQLFGERRVASRLLPATSLFSTISDSASSELGLDGNQRLYPRLSVGGRLALQWIDTDRDVARGYRVTTRARLDLDEAGSEQLLLEVSRRGGLSASYNAVYLALERALGEQLFVHAAGELVSADRRDGGSQLYPYANVGLRYETALGLSVAGALIARATPTYASEVSALVRVTYAEKIVP